MFNIKKDNEIFSCKAATIEGFSNNSKSNIPSYVCLPAKKTLKKKQIEKFENNGKNIVCGVNSGDAIYCADENIETNPNWFQVPGGLQNVSVSNGRLYGTNSGNNIYYADNYKNAQWAQVPGGLKQVSLDGKANVVVGVNSGDAIYYADQNIQDRPNWTQVPGGLINVSVSNGQLYGCNRGNAIYYAANYKNAQWVQIPGSLSQVSLDGYNRVVCGVNSNQDIWCADQNITSNPNWFQVPGNLIWVSISNGKLYGVNSSNNIYFASDYKNAKWVQVPGGLKQVSLDYSSNSLLASGCEGQGATVQCPSGQTIAGGSIKYGRWNNNVCPHGTVNGNTAARVATGQLPNHCIGKNSCQFNVDNNYGLGDPYGGTYKHFEISPQCVGSKSINIVEASYGINCNGGLKGNRTDLFKRLMDGKPAVQYKFDYTQTGGDPAGGCGKTLEVKFHCGDNDIQTLVVPPEAGYNGAVNIDCSKADNSKPPAGVNVYSNSVTYKAGDTVFLNGVIYRMVRDADGPGKSPEDAGSQLWQKSNSGIVKYVRLAGGSDYLNLSQLVVTDSLGVNVAKGRQTQSSGVGWDGPQAAAVDGAEASRGHPNEYHSSGGNAVFQVVLDKPTQVTSVTVYNRADCCQGRMGSGYKIYLLNEKGEVVFTSANLTGEAKQIIPITGPAAGPTAPKVYANIDCPKNYIQVGLNCYPKSLADKKYTFLPGIDFGGNDIKKSDKENDFEALAADCDATNGCIGFNTNGYLKNVARPGTQSKWTDDGAKGFYLKGNNLK